MKIDFTYLEMVSDGDADFIRQFVDTFEKTYESLTKKMSDEFAANDLVNLGKSAHQLKPSAKMLHLESGDDLENIQNDPSIATEEKLKFIEENCKEGLAQLKTWAKEKGVD